MAREEQRTPIRMSHPKPIVPRPLVALFAACLVIIVLYAALITILHTESMYRHITGAQERQENAAVLSYLTGPLGAANRLDFLTPAEASHMTDVKRLLDAAFILNLCAAGIIIGMIAVFAVNRMWERFDELLGRSLRAAGWTILAFCFVLGLATLINFDRLWVLFHAILFPQGNWAFPYDSVLITLYPPSFWEAAVIRWTAYILSFAVVAIMLSHIMERMRRAEHHFSMMREQRPAQQPGQAAQQRSRQKKS